MVDVEVDWSKVWEKYSDPAAMLNLLDNNKEERYTDRKSTLFGVACCRNVISLVVDKIRKGLNIAESIADREYDYNDVKEQIKAIYEARGHIRDGTVWRVNYAVTLCLSRSYDPIEIAYNCSSLPKPKSITEERSKQCDLLRDIIGNPFSKVELLQLPKLVEACGPFETDVGIIDQQYTNDTYCPWLTPDVLALAKSAYYKRLPSYTLDSSCLSSLSDALEEAGCDSIGILNHLRDSSKPHVRGCWVVDLLLGKE